MKCNLDKTILQETAVFVREIDVSDVQCIFEGFMSTLENFYTFQNSTGIFNLALPYGRRRVHGVSGA